ncbi:FKBP-type peptidyl-prolyl cis-trans isomerase [Penaeicola halotolerans]|uniref:FKBP-type peptidyl-prolyl cis-trans isomerase n=1 Tax=Penaeicola halotolerans TaxID=2793196 RepID=UPI001CF7F3AD|nr:FKBP-type peptidyl-prolyl cis-trans isomerase [Penaeicola halotolerans]
MKLTNKLFALIALAGIIGLSSCLRDLESDAEKLQQQDNKRLADFIRDNNITATFDPTGFYYSVLTDNPEGDTIANNDILGIYYTMTDLSGTPIDTYQASNGLPKLFQVTDSSILPFALNLAAGLMKEGETYRLYIPSYLAYGENSFEGLPGRTSLIVDLTIAEKLSLEDVAARDEEAILAFIAENEYEGVEEVAPGVYFQVLEAGEGDSAAVDQLLDVRYEAFYFDDFQVAGSVSPVTIRVGNESTLLGLNEAFQYMNRGQKNRVILSSEKAHGKGLQIIPERLREVLFNRGLISTNVRAYEPIVYEFEVLNVR